MDEFKELQIEVMLSKSLVGKAPPEWEPADWRKFYKSFKRTKLSVYGLAGMIWQGFSFTPVYANGRRLEENFTIAYHMAFDFDNDGASLDFLMRPGTVAQTFASFAYSTPSSTEDHPKSRVVFCLPAGITDAGQFRELYQAIALEFAREGSRTDAACKDPLRLYYGSPGCNLIPNWSALLPDTIEFLVNRYRRENPPARQVVDPTTGVLPATDDYIEQRLNGILEQVIFAPDGEKHRTLNKAAYTVGGYVGAGHISAGEAVAKLDAAISANGRAKNISAARRTIETAVSRGAERPLPIVQTYKRNLDEIL